MARVRGTTSHFQPQNYIFLSPCNFGVAKDMVLVRRGVLGDVHRFFVFWIVFLGGFRFFLTLHGAQGCFRWQEPILEEKQVPRRFHGGFGPDTKKQLQSAAKSPHSPKRSELSGVQWCAASSPQCWLWPPPPLQSRRVCFVSGGIVDPKPTKDPDAVVSRWVSGFGLDDLVLSFMVFHVRFTSLMLGAFKFTVWKAAEHHKGCPPHWVEQPRLGWDAREARSGASSKRLAESAHLQG